MSINNVIENGFCIGCGSCNAVSSDKVEISMKSDGFFAANVKNGLTTNEEALINKVCPFSSSAKNEDQLSSSLFGASEFDERVGYFRNVYAGSVKSKSDRLGSSSGGLTTWFATKLFENNEIDGVIHVGSSENMFEYKISNSIEELTRKGNKKSRYYPVSYEGVIQEVIKSNKRYLFVGTPCFVKSIRLLQSENIANNIKFTVSLLCGHMKSRYFSESLSWQLGVLPKDLESLDFRVKSKEHRANDYFIEALSKKGDLKTEKNSALLGTNWGHGFFKHKACDFCDDIAGETADVTFGDAWLNEYTADYLGTNIVLSRSQLFDSYITKYYDEVNIDTLTVDDFYNSQAGNYRHRREGLKVRLDSIAGWKPKKRDFESTTKLSKQRKKLYLYRYNLAQKSSRVFRFALKHNNIYLYKLTMLPLIIKYESINRSGVGLIKYIVKLLMPKSILRRKK